MKIRVFTLLCLFCVIGCAARNIPPDPGPAEMPRAAWTLKAGSANRQDLVCTSSSPMPCVVTLNQDEGVFAAISVYLYAAGAKTTYKGSVFSSFLTDVGFETPISFEIQPSERPIAFSHFDRVVAAQGSYEFRVALSADVAGEEAQRSLQFVVPVRLVGEPGSSRQVALNAASVAPVAAAVR